MKANVGKADRAVRFVLGALIVAAGVYFKSWFGVIGIVFMVTALIRFCPAYLPFGFSSLKK